MKKVKMSSLSLKFMLAFIVLGVLVCICTSVAGYIQYGNNIRKQYNSIAYDIAETALTYTDEDELARYASLARGYIAGTVSFEEIEEEIASERYKAISEQIENLREAMGANDVFIFCVDVEELNVYSDDGNWSPLIYLFDSYTVSEYSYVLGDVSGFNTKYIDELATIAQTGERVNSYFISDGDYGYNTTAILPVTCGDDIVMIAVEIPMHTLNSALLSYIIGAVLVTVAVVAVVIVINYFVFRKMFVSPIRRMAAAASDFIDGGTDAKITSSISALTIKTRDELGVLCESLKQMERNIFAYMDNLQNITAERERISTELNVARNIQTSMLPCIFPAFPDRDDFDIYATMVPAKAVGGDFYDFFMVDKTHIAVVIADVSGKGVPAALFMVIGKTLIKDHTVPDCDLGDVFTEVNELLCETNSEGLFITAFEGVLDLETGELRYVNAGHEMPFICSNGNFEVQKIKHGFVLAGMEGMKYSTGVFNLQPGDKLFQYTDGVTEATNYDSEFYGRERLSAVLNKSVGLSPEELIATVKQDIDEFAGGAPQFDDITMLCIEYKQKSVGDSGLMDELTIDATIENISRVTEFVDGRLESFGCPKKIRIQMNIAIDELFGNIAHYAYDPDVGPATVRVEVSEDMVVLTFIDQGVPYDPLANADPDIKLSAEERGIGGLGIYIVKKTMDDITYEYKDGKNILRIKKNMR